MTRDVVVTTNSPGELHSWVRGTVGQLRRLEPGLRVTVALVPCPYASGVEARVARALPGVDQVLTPRQTLALMLGGGRAHLPSGRGGAVVFLGGEPWHALWLARRLGLPSVGYLDRPRRWAGRFTRVGVVDALVAERLQRRGVARVSTVGNLTLGAVELPPAGVGAPAPSGMTLGLFPGSRGLHLRASLGVFLRAAEQIAEARPEASFLLALSPFVGPAELDRALARPIPLGLPSSRARVSGDLLVTERGLEVELVWGRPYEVMERMALGLTIPGTNTAEMACFGRPMVVVMSAAAPLPRGGLGGLLDRLPLASSWKQGLRRRTYSRVGLAAQPNRLAGRMVVPEVVARRAIEEISGPVLELLGDPARRRAMGRELEALTGGRDGCQRMARLILEGLA